MAFVLKNCFVSVDGTDLSLDTRDVSVDMSADSVDVTSMGAGAHQILAGLRSDKFTFTMYSNYDPGRLDAILYPKFTAGGTVAVIVRPTSGTVSTGNPQYSGGCSILTYSPVAGGIGAAAMTTVDLPLTSGTISRATS